ncbi:hypothetical protein EJ110_NYTH30574 [Nymphaea thermarum]|nr:hypothetical protein EJ110_NYTH30574 [Nymphaea thermarum]
MAMILSSAKHRRFTRRCSQLVKEQKARLYILRRAGRRAGPPSGRPGPARYGPGLGRENPGPGRAWAQQPGPIAKPGRARAGRAARPGPIPALGQSGGLCPSPSA